MPYIMVEYYLNTIRYGRRLHTMNTNVDMEKLQENAVKAFTTGFACSESVIVSLREALNLDIPDSAIAMSSGFPWGLGGGGCLCGAAAGGTMCIGFVYGRTDPGNPKINRCFELTNEFHDKFKEKFGATCCGELIKDFPDRDAPERKNCCIEYVKFAVSAVAEILIREAIKDGAD